MKPTKMTSVVGSPHHFSKMKATAGSLLYLFVFSRKYT